MPNKIDKTDAEWRLQLSDEEYRVLRLKGTERPFSGKFNMHFQEGVYRCRACNTPLFTSESKFDAGCGWPSFDSQVSPESVVFHKDNSLGMIRTEICCGKCAGHLGHVFDDGPTTTGLRYCVNSVSIDFDGSQNK